MKNLLIGAFSILVASLIGFIAFSFANTNDEAEPQEINTQLYSSYEDGDFINTKIKGKDFRIEVAKTLPAKAQGLQEVTSLDDDYGMIFLYDEESVRTFHMRNVFVSLDMIFLNADFEIVKMHTNTKINQGEELYSSVEPTQYVLEFEAGTAEELGLREGDELLINN